MPYTFPNQRVVKINRETIQSDFLGIKNENWQAAAKDLKAHALMLYLYLASNANGFELALSPAAVENAIGMPRSTYSDQFKKLVEKGYLVQTNANHYNFYEVPQKQTDCQQKNENDFTATVDKNDQCTTSVDNISNLGQVSPPVNAEINNINIKNKIVTDNIDLIPKTEEITITVPKRESKNSVQKGFVF